LLDWASAVLGVCWTGLLLDWAFAVLGVCWIGCVSRPARPEALKKKEAKLKKGSKLKKGAQPVLRTFALDLQLIRF
jgi:hypothetical protein